jgi:hypothetical protein
LAAGQAIRERLRNGQGVVIHCRDGLGRSDLVDRVGRHAWKGVKQGASGKAWGRGDSAAGSIRFEVTEAGLTNAKNFILARSVFRSVRPAVLTWSISDFRLLAQSQPH